MEDNNDVNCSENSSYLELKKEHDILKQDYGHTFKMINSLSAGMDLTASINEIIRGIIELIPAFGCLSSFKRAVLTELYKRIFRK